MIKFLEAKNLLELNGHVIQPKYPQDEESITNAERMLGVSFPESYKYFLTTYGTLDIGSEGLSAT